MPHKFVSKSPVWSDPVKINRFYQFNVTCIKANGSFEVDERLRVIEVISHIWVDNKKEVWYRFEKETGLIYNASNFVTDDDVQKKRESIIDSLLINDSKLASWSLSWSSWLRRKFGN